jgi:hypothetical protein
MISVGSYLTVFRLVWFYNIAAKGFALGWVGPNGLSRAGVPGCRVLYGPQSGCTVVSAVKPVPKWLQCSECSETLWPPKRLHCSECSETGQSAPSHTVCRARGFGAALGSS